MPQDLPMSNPEALPSAPTTLVQPVRFPRHHSLAQQLSQVLLVGALALASYFLISHFLVESVRVVGESMHPTLENSQRYLLNRWVLYLRAPHRGEIVVIRDPLDDGLSVKRVVAIAGDRINIKDGMIYVNGKRLSEPYLQPGTPTFAGPYLDEQQFQCQPGQFFVLGDNRNNSVDSRAYGPVSRRAILGLIVR